MGAARRFRVRGSAQPIVLIVGVAAGATLAVRGLSPTGAAATDWLVLTVAAVGGVWAAASAPWWSLSGLAAIAALLAPPVAPLLVGLGVLTLSFAVGLARRDQPVERAAIGGVSMLLLSLSRDVGPFGLTTAVSVIAVSTVAVCGWSRRSHHERRVALTVVGAVAAIIVVGTLAALTAGLAARPDLTAGDRLARQGLRDIERGEFDLAQTSFERAAMAFERAARDLDAPWAQVGRLAPIVSQHRTAGSTLASAAASTTTTIADQLAQIDFSRLRIVDGRIDVDAVRDLQTPMARLEAALDELHRVVVDVDDGWLARPVRDRLDSLQIEIADRRQLGADASAALAAAPAMLGDEGERVYFVMFTTPAEARGSGGFMGNYAEITIDDGVIEMTGFGRHSDLNRATDGTLTLDAAPPDWMHRYGPQGFAIGADASVVRDPWSIINLSPHFPSTAQVIQELYPQSGGRHLDGVFSLDVFALERLIALVSPIPVEDGARQLDATNAARYLLVDQYQFAERAGRAARIDQLEVVAHESIDRLLRSMPPDPIDIGRALAPMVRQRRLLGWLAQPDEQNLMRSIDMDGDLLGNLVGEDGIAVVAVNDGASKMDTYLGRSMQLERRGDGDQLTVEISHDAPVGQIGPAVIGGTSAVEPGWARIWLTVNTTRLVESATLDGHPAELHLAVENGVGAYAVFLELAPATKRTLTLELAPTRIGADALVVQPQPLVRPEVWTTPDGTFEVTEERTLAWSRDASP